MNVIVLGVTGFIGQYFINNYSVENINYKCLVRKTSKNIDKIPQKDNIKVDTIDFNFEELVEAFKNNDVVIDMIGQMGGHDVTEEMFVKTNCELNQMIIDACKASGIKQLIYISTPGVQGFGKRKCLETDPYKPRNLYEETKVTAEKTIIKELSGTDINYTIIRPDFVYGPGDYRRIKMYKNIRDKKFVLTTSGKSYLHPTHVGDVSQGIAISIDNPNAFNQIFNISARDDISVNDYLNTIAKAFDKKVVKINIGYRLSIICASIIELIFEKILKKEAFVSKNKIDFLAIDHSTSCEKAISCLGYNPKYDFATGFSDTMDWLKNNDLL